MKFIIPIVLGIILSLFVFEQTVNFDLACVSGLVPPAIVFFLWLKSPTPSRTLPGSGYSTNDSIGYEYGHQEEEFDSRRHEHPEHRPNPGPKRTSWREVKSNMSEAEIEKRAYQLSALMAGKISRGEIPGDPRRYLRDYVTGERYAGGWTKQEEANMRKISERAILIWEEWEAAERGRKRRG